MKTTLKILLIIGFLLTSINIHPANTGPDLDSLIRKSEAKTRYICNFEGAKVYIAYKEVSPDILLRIIAKEYPSKSKGQSEIVKIDTIKYVKVK